MVVRVALVALFTTVTVTPGTTPPVESFTSPVMVPSVCATHGAQHSNHVHPTNRIRRMAKAPFARKGLRRSTEDLEKTEDCRAQLTAGRREGYARR